MFDLSVQWLVTACDASLKALLLAATAALVLRVLRVRDSNVRHRVWTGVLAGMLMLPALSQIVPALQLPIGIDAAWLLEQLRASHSVEPVVEEVAAVEPVVPEVAEITPEADVALSAAEPSGDAVAGTDNLTPGRPRMDGAPWGDAPWRMEGGYPPMNQQPAGPAVEPQPSFAERVAAARAVATTAIDHTAEIAAVLRAKQPAPWQPGWLHRWPLLLAVVWIGGSLLLAARLLAACIVAWQLRRACSPITTEELEDLGIDVAVLQRSGLSRSRGTTAVHECPLVRVPLTLGALRPRILLPADWLEWPTEKLQAVLTHEASHVARADCAVTLLVELNRCVYWFHPLAWWLRGHLSRLAEEACDDAAIDLTGDRTTYARHLLEVAAEVSHQSGRVIHPGVSMARRSNVETRINTILDFHRPLTKRLNWATTLLLLGVIIPAIALAAALRPSAGEEEPVAEAVEIGEVSSETPPPLAAVEQESPEGAAAQSEDVSAQEPVESSAGDVTVRGVVLKPDGSPAAGATVRAAGPKWASLAAMVPSDYVTSMSETVANDRGEFSITFNKQPMGDLSSIGGTYVDIWKSTRVAASLAGFGAAWVKYEDIETPDAVTLQLVEDAPIEGRVIDLEGRPLSGVAVTLSNPTLPKDGDLSPWIAALKNGEPAWTAHTKAGESCEPRLIGLPDKLMTQDDGTFSIRGLGKERIVTLAFDGEEVSHREARAITRRLETVQRVITPSTSEVEPVFGSTFTFIADPARLIEGTVKDAATGKPLAGVSIESYKLAGYPFVNNRVLKTRSDAEGHYRLAGAPKGEGNQLIAIPADGQPYFMREVKVPDPVGLEPIALDIELHHGVLISGRVTDRSTGEPVPAVRIHYFPYRTNEHAQAIPEFGGNLSSFGDQMRYQTDRDGRYQIVALPGPAVLGVWSVFKQFRMGSGFQEAAGKTQDGKRLDTYGNPIFPAPQWPTMIQPIDPAADAGEMSVDFALDPGASLRLHVVDEAGQPVTGALFDGIGGSVSSEGDVTPATVTAVGLGPDDSRVIVVRHDQRRIGRVIKVGPAEVAKGEITVDLQPFMSLKGRLLNPDNEPMTGLEVQPFVLPAASWSTTLASCSSDEQGNFDATLVPGCTYMVQAVGRGISGGAEIVGELKVEPGEAKDLGVLTYKKGKGFVSEAKGAPGKSFRFFGRVLDPEGKPVAGAAVRISRVTQDYDRAPRQSRLIAEQVSNAAGAFDFTVPLNQLPSTSRASGRAPFDGFNVLAAAPGFGVAMGAPESLEEEKAFDLTLAREEPIRGKLLDLEGRPLADVKVDVIELNTGSLRRLEQWLAGFVDSGPGDLTRPLKGDPDLAVQEATVKFDCPLSDRRFVSPEDLPTATTDQAGRFELRGIGGDRLVYLRIAGPGIATSIMPVLSRETRPLRTKLMSQYAAFDRCYGATFEHIADPGIDVEGYVRDARTQAPIGGMRVLTSQLNNSEMTGFLRTIADDRGYYRLHGLPAGKRNSLRVSPTDQPYLEEFPFVVPTTTGPQTASLDVELNPAAWVSGRVTDEATGQPVQGRVYFSPFKTNPHLEKYPSWKVGSYSSLDSRRSDRTDADGRFRTRTIPGRGLLFFMADDRDYCYGNGMERIPELANLSQVSSDNSPTVDLFGLGSVHAIAEVNPPESSGEVSTDMQVSHGRKITLHLAGPDGRPVIGAQVNGHRMNAEELLYTDTVEVIGLKPGVGRTIRLWHPPTGLMKHLSLLPAENETERTVVLESPAIVTGRILKPDGTPWVDLPIQHQWFEHNTGGLSRWGATDSDGRFRHPLADGGPYEVLSGWWKYNSLRKGLTVKGGELIDLGDLVVDLDKPWEPAEAKGPERRSLTDDTYGLGFTRDTSSLWIDVEEDGSLELNTATLTLDSLSTHLHEPTLQADFIVRSNGAVRREHVDKVLQIFRDAKYGRVREEVTAGRQATSMKAPRVAPETDSLPIGRLMSPLVSTPPATRRIFGRVLDPQGQPVANARVQVSRTWNTGQYAAAYASVKLADVSTDADGRFECQVNSRDVPEPWARDFGEPREWVNVTASSAGLGMAYTSTSGRFAGGKPRDVTNGEPVELHLAADEAVHGRVLDLEGRPVPNARIDVYALSWCEPQKLDEWLSQVVGKEFPWREEQLVTSAMSLGIEKAGPEAPYFPAREYCRIAPGELPSATSDAEGRFELTGIGKDRLAILRIGGPGIATSLAQVLTRPVETFQARAMTRTRLRNLWYGSKFDFIADPSAPVEGVIRDVETGEPLPGAVVATESIAGETMSADGFLSTVADEQGRYRLEGLPISGKHRLEVIPNGQAYLMTGSLKVPAPVDLQPVTRDIELKRAVWVTGQVIDVATGKPVQGRVGYTPFIANEHLKGFPQYTDTTISALQEDDDYATDAEGRFRIPVCPGRGVIYFVAAEDVYRPYFGQKDIPEFVRRDGKGLSGDVTCDAFSPFHSMTVVEPRPDDTEVRQDIRVDSGTTLTLRFVDPQGKPLAGVEANGLRGLFSHRNVDGDSATVYGLSPEDVRLVTLTHQNSSTRALVALSPRPGETERTVTLGPAAVVSGRVLTGVDQPFAEGWMEMEYPPGMDAKPAMLSVLPRAQCDKTGRFECQLPAGGPYTLKMVGKPYGVLVEDMHVAAGERVELGDLHVNAADPSQPAAARGPPQRSMPLAANASPSSGASEKAAPTEPAGNDDDPTFIYRGAVVDEAGRPVAGAAITLSYWRKSPPPADAPPLAVTDAEGKFEFSRRKSEFADGGAAGVWKDANLLAMKEGFGFASALSKSFETSGRLAAELSEIQRLGASGRPAASSVLTLVADDVPIRGRVVNTEGQPIAGVKVEPVNFWGSKQGTLDAWIAATKQPGADYYSANRELTLLHHGGFLTGPQGTVVLPTTTDADGRFTLRGIGRERIATLYISGTGIETKWMYVRTRQGEPIRVRRTNQRGDDVETILPNEFVHVTAPAQAVEGTVTDERTGQPLSGLLVKLEVLGSNDDYNLATGEVGYFRDTTDPAGHYRIDGLPAGAHEIAVYPAAGSRHMPGAIVARIGAETNSLKRNVALVEGVWITGTVRDTTTDRPIDGHLEYFTFQDNPAIAKGGRFRRAFLGAEYWTTNGQFAVPVPPGKGILTFRAAQSDLYPRGVGAEKIEGPTQNLGIKVFETVPSFCIPTNYHLLTPLDVAPDAADTSLDLAIGSGRTLTFRVHGPDGAPLSDYEVAGEPGWGGDWREHSGHWFEIRGYFPADRRTLRFFHPDTNLYGEYLLTGDVPDRIEVTLREQAGKITGRVIDDFNVPQDGLLLSNPARRFWSDDTGVLSLHRKGRQAVTDTEGRFEVNGVIPGLKYTLNASAYTKGMQRFASEIGTIFEGVTVAAGETKDLGDLRIKPYQPPPPPEPKPQEPKPDAPRIKVGPGMQGAPAGLKTRGPMSAAPANDVATSSPEQPPAQPRRYQGRVVDTAGQPVAGATIWLAAVVDLRGRSELRELGRSNENGDFNVEISPDFALHFNLAASGMMHRLIASAPRFGCDGQPIVMFEATLSDASLRDASSSYIDRVYGAGRFAGRTLVLPPLAEPIQGRLVDLEGKPLADVQVVVRDLRNVDMAMLQQGFEKGASQLTSQASVGRYISMGDSARGLFPPAVTNADGEFTLAGLGRDQLATLTFVSDRVDAELLYVVGRDMPAKSVPQLFDSPNGWRDTYTGTRFTHVLGPAVPIYGTVTELRSGAPVPNAEVFVERLFSGPGRIDSPTRHGTQHIRTVTDAEGRYRLTGIPPGEGHVLNVIPQKSEPLIVAAHTFSLPPDQGDAEVNLQMMRGIWIEGRVTDGTSGLPLQGEVTYSALRSNPNTPDKFGLGIFTNADRIQSDAEGRYRLPGLPGKGIVQFRFAGKTVYPRRIGAEQVEGFDPRLDYIPVINASGPLSSWNRIQQIDPPLDATSFTCDLTLTAGQSVVGRALLPDGSAVTSLKAFGMEELDGFWKEQKTSEFTVTNYDGTGPRDLYFKTADNRLAAHARLQGSAPRELVVTLQPTVTVSGRLIETETADPAEGYMVLCASTSRGKFRFDEVVTREDGTFEITGLVPGIVYRVSTANPRHFSSGKNNFQIDLTAAKSGDVIALGDVTGKDANPATKVPKKEKKETEANAGAGMKASPKMEAKPQNTPTGQPPRGPEASGGTGEEAASQGTSSNAEAETITIRGVVRLPDGSPAAGAELLLPVPDRVRMPLEVSAELQVKGTTGRDGSFEFRCGRGEIAPERNAAQLVAHLDGYALEWSELKLQPGPQRVELTLRPERRLRGQVLDLEGRPVAGASVQVRTLQALQPGKSFDEYLQNWMSEWRMSSGVMRVWRCPRSPLLEATSDGEGRFSLAGVGADQVCDLLVRGPGVAVTAGWVFVRDGIDVAPYSRAADEQGPYKPRLFGPDFTCVCEPEFVLTGRVVDEKGRPVAGAALWSNFGLGELTSTRSDDAGAFELRNLARGRPCNLSVAKEESDLLACEVFLEETSADLPPLEIELQRGVVVTGRVSELDGGAGVTGYVRYFALPDNPHGRQPGYNGNYSTHTSRDDGGEGRYRLAVPPGPGVLVASAMGSPWRVGDDVRSPYRTARITPEDAAFIPHDGDSITTAGDNRYSIDMENTIKYVNFAAGSASQEVDLRLDRGRELEVDVVDGAGRPVEGLLASGVTEDWPITATVPGSRFPVSALGSDAPRTTAVLAPGRGLGGSVKLTGDEPSPLRLTLTPLAHLNGRAVDSAGTPLADTELLLNFADASVRELYRRHNLGRVRLRTDAEGGFSAQGLLPGADFNLDMRLGEDRYLRGHVDKAVRNRLQPGPSRVRFNLQPGGEYDLGDVTFVPPGQSLSSNTTK